MVGIVDGGVTGSGATGRRDFLLEDLHHARAINGSTVHLRDGRRSAALGHATDIRSIDRGVDTEDGRACCRGGQGERDGGTIDTIRSDHCTPWSRKVHVDQRERHDGGIITIFVRIIYINRTIIDLGWADETEHKQLAVGAVGSAAQQGHAHATRTTELDSRRSLVGVGIENEDEKGVSTKGIDGCRSRHRPRV